LAVIVDGHLKVFELSANLELGRLRLDTTDKPFLVEEAAWVRGGLLYFTLKDAQDTTSGYPYDFVEKNGQIQLWDPSTGQERVLRIPGVYDIFVPNRKGDRVALFCSLVDSPTFKSGMATMSILALPAGEIVRNFEVKVSLVGRIQRLNFVYPLFWSADDQCLFIISEDVGPDPYSPKRSTTLYPVLRRWAMDGSVKQLSRTWVPKWNDKDMPVQGLLIDSRWSVFGYPWVTPLAKGGDIACFLGIDTPYYRELLIGYFSCDGLMREKLLLWEDWPELWRRRDKEGWHVDQFIISVTPEGKGILFQDFGDVRKTEGFEEMPLYVWDMDNGEMVCLGQAPKIMEVYDWLGGRYLPFRTNMRRSSREYGVIELRESQAAAE